MTSCYKDSPQDSWKQIVDYIWGIGVQVQEGRIMLLQIGGGLENKEVPQCHLRLFATI